MKTMKNILRFLPAAVVSAFTLVGCTNDVMDRINKNPNDPKIVPVNYIFPELIAGTATYAVGGDASLYASVYMEIEAGVHGQMRNAEVRVTEPTSATTYNNSWEAIYVNIRNAKDIIAICDNESIIDGGSIIKGMTQVMEAINLATLTNYFGDVPYSQTAIFDATTGMPVYLQPVVDKQEDLYKAIFKLLDDAETNIGKTDGAPAAASDMVYGGNKALWIKAINALRARYTLQLLHVSPTATADLDAILGYINNSFANASEQMSFTHYDGNETYNPLGAFFYSRYGLGVSQSFVDLLAAKKDPRVMQWGYSFNQVDADGKEILDGNGDPIFNPDWADDIPAWLEDDENILAAPNGSPIEAQLYYSYSNAYLAEWAPVHFISYHELMFIKAEVLARKNDPTAIDALEEAVLAACANMEDYLEGGLSEEVAQEYFDNTVTPAFGLNALNEIMIQKYIACSGASGELHVAYDDYRRMKAMGEDGYLTLANPKNATSQFPLRFTYGVSDVNNNANVYKLYGDGRYVYSKNVWWAGGTEY